MFQCETLKILKETKYLFPLPFQPSIMKYKNGPQPIDFLFYGTGALSRSKYSVLKYNTSKQMQPLRLFCIRNN